MAYVDTNVILTKYFPDDKQHIEAASFLELNKKEIISPVSVVELAAVANNSLCSSRRRNLHFMLARKSFAINLS